MVFENILNPILSPLLKLPSLVAVVLISFIVSLIIIIITKYTTNQKLMKEMKEQMKDYQKQIKESRSNPQKAMEIQKKAMEVNMKYMVHSFKPTIITFIPIILIFGWMSSHFAFENIKPNQEFNVYAIFDENAKGQAEILVTEGLKIVSNKNSKIQSGTIGKNEYKKLAKWILEGSEGEHILEVLHDGEKKQH